MKNLWRLWALSLGEKVGESEQDADAVAVIRTVVVLINVVCCFFIMTNIVLSYG